MFVEGDRLSYGLYDKVRDGEPPLVREDRCKERGNWDASAERFLGCICSNCETYYICGGSQRSECGLDWDPVEIRREEGLMVNLCGICLGTITFDSEGFQLRVGPGFANLGTMMEENDMV